MVEDIGMDELLAQTSPAGPGSIVEGTVVGESDAYLLVNVGLKQEAVLSAREFPQEKPAAGQKISVLIVRLSGPEGRPLVSWRQAREKLNWDKIASAFQKGDVVPGKIVQRVKGGVNVDIGLDAFMPASQIDIRSVGNPDQWVGQSVSVKILEMDREKSNVLVSRRKVLEDEKASKRAHTLAEIQEGQVVKGRITAITKFGAFVDIGGIEGLLHSSDVAWVHVENLNKVLKAGQELDVKILKYDRAAQKISLGRKQLLPHPWDGIETRFPLNSIIKGKVTGLVDFGAFVEIEPGVEGLVHISEFSWTETIKHPKDVLKPDQEVQAKIIGIDRDKEKMSLSLKRLGPSPWEAVAQQFPVGTRVDGEVTRITSFGAFIRVSNGIEGLLKPHDYSWTEKVHSLGSLLKVGDKITTQVLDIDPDTEKMALGIKQLKPDPLKALKMGQAVNATVVKVLDKGLLVRLESGLEGLIRSQEAILKKSIFTEPDPGAPNQRVEELPYKEGEAVTASVIKIDRRERKIELSIRRYEKDQERELLKKYSGKNDKLTLGETTGWQEESS